MTYCAWCEEELRDDVDYTDEGKPLCKACLERYEENPDRNHWVFPWERNKTRRPTKKKDILR